MDNAEWDRAAGVSCPRCGRETHRFLAGLCATCNRAKVAEQERKLALRSVRRGVRRGLLRLKDLRGMS